MLAVHRPGNAMQECARGRLRHLYEGIAQGDDDFLADASLYRIGSDIFFIAEGAGTNNRGDVPLSLWRKRGLEAPVELVEGVESLRVLYGVDTTGDRVPNRYQGIDQIVNRERIVTMRVTLTANSVDVVSEQQDGILRRDFTKTIAIRNRI
jgi:hypothetical protein